MIMFEKAFEMREKVDWIFKKIVKILPVDSEHNSIFQCFDSNQRKNISHITLTASGGPFLNRSLESFYNVTIEEALKHPNWEMGKKFQLIVQH